MYHSTVALGQVNVKTESLLSDEVIPLSQMDVAPNAPVGVTIRPWLDWIVAVPADAVDHWSGQAAPLVPVHVSVIGAVMGQTFSTQVSPVSQSTGWVGPT